MSLWKFWPGPWILLIVFIVGCSIIVAIAFTQVQVEPNTIENNIPTNTKQEVVCYPAIHRCFMVDVVVENATTVCSPTLKMCYGIEEPTTKKHLCLDAFDKLCLDAGTKQQSKNCLDLKEENYCFDG